MSTKDSLELYRKLVLVRKSQEALIAEYPFDEIKTPVHMSMGQEALAVGVCHALGRENQLWTSYRTHAAFIAKTDNTDKFFGELYGKVSGTARGKAGSMHLADPEHGYMMSSAIVGGQIAPAVGMAYANKYKQNGLISCVMFGDGAVDEGCFWESLNIACVMKLPVLFVCEDNGLAAHTRLNVRQGYENLDEVISKFDIYVQSHTTTDVEDITWITQNALKKIKSTGKPVFLHFKCYRYLEHVGVNEDFQAGYRDIREYQHWLEHDCVTIQRNTLLESGISEAVIVYIEGEMQAQVETSIRRSKVLWHPSKEELYTGVYYETA
jgi:acetoin:2,6-dichlorophenolindophenol oxidoreductase subunit alpha